MTKKVMSRKEFVKKVGGAAAFGLLATCLGGCTKMDNPDSPVPRPLEREVDFTLDLTAPENASLLVNGGYVIVNNTYVVAKDETGNYIAATRLCSHNPEKQIYWDTSFNEWTCAQHYATFDKNGNGTTTINNFGANGLTIYNTELTGNLLRITSL